MNSCVGQPAKKESKKKKTTYIHQLCAYTVCRLEDLSSAMGEREDGKRATKESVLFTLLDDDDDDDDEFLHSENILEIYLRRLELLFSGVQQRTWLYLF